MNRKQQLEQFVQQAHDRQVRKYTGNPYYDHLQAVGNMAKEYKLCYGYEIGLCHDLLEDTDIDKSTLYHALCRFGYSIGESNDISDAVLQLSDVFTHEVYPNLNREYRKKKEAERLHCISDLAQSVKYCDIIDNTKSIVEHDKGFARVYLTEIDFILKGMKDGNQELYKLCLETVKNAKSQL